jgi:hypothetical protein
MTDIIEPALTPEQWAKGIPKVYGYDDGSVFLDWRVSPMRLDDGPHAIIAALNAALPDDDPRKITQAMIAVLREFAEAPGYGWSDADGNNFPNEELTRIADALASYLPPEP